MKSWLIWFENWRLLRKLRKAEDVLIYCGQNNGSVQELINDAKECVYAAVREAEMRYKVGGNK